MKKVIKDTKLLPKSLENCDSKIKIALIEKGKCNFSDYTFAHPSVKLRLNEIYNNKCAYCETDTTAGSVLQVEHYRPKANVKKDNNHNGYYWLAYEWSNLIYVCSACNIAKTTNFPICKNGVRIYSPPLKNNNLDKSKCKSNYLDLINEKPLILNPEELNFKPEEHFLISLKGEIIGITNRATKTIDVCKLNRKNLIFARKKIIENHFDNMQIDFNFFNDDKINSEQLKYGLQKEVNRIIDRINKDASYTFLAKLMLLNFDYFFCNRFQTNEKTILKEVYRNLLFN